MYGTVMVCTYNGDRDAAIAALEDWRTARSDEVKGFVDAGLLFGDDGSTMVNYVIFTSKQDYQDLADDPRQDEWYQTRIAPLLTAEPRWIDGEWADLPL